MLEVLAYSRQQRGLPSLHAKQNASLLMYKRSILCSAARPMCPDAVSHSDALHTTTQHLKPTGTTNKTWQSASPCYLNIILALHSGVQVTTTTIHFQTVYQIKRIFIHNTKSYMIPKNKQNLLIWELFIQSDVIQSGHSPRW